MTYGMNAAGAADVNSAISKIREKFLQGLEDRANLIEGLVGELGSPETAEQISKEIRAHAHKLHGLAGTVGFPRIGALAAQLEHHIDLVMDGPRPVDTNFTGELAQTLLAEIDAQLDS
ncbi:MAG: Hpt domain-containing protein [Brevirhabdus sp.]